MAPRPAGRIQLARLDDLADAAERRGRGWLTADEATRLQAMASASRQRSFLAGHWLARRTAADWLGVDATRVALHRHDDGRPALLVDGHASVLSLSLSHSGDWLACVVATVPVGIDVELPQRERDFEALARFTFSPGEVERLRGLPESERAAAFHVLWTLKEARGKRLGEGLLPGRSRRVTTLASDARDADATTWAFGDGALAVAVEAGTDLAVDGGDTLGGPAYWRYVDDA